MSAVPTRHRISSPRSPERGFEKSDARRRFPILPLSSTFGARAEYLAMRASEETSMEPRRTLAIALSALPLWAVLTVSTAAAQAPPKTESVPSAAFNVVKASAAVEIDGVLDEAAWAAAPAIPLPFE